MKALTLFSSSGIGEYYLHEIGIDVIAANELIKKRCDLYQKIHPNSKMICGDIRDKNIKEILKSFDVDIIICSPPCQGISIAGLSRNNRLRLQDERNYLVFHALDIIKSIKPKYILFENVPAFGKMYLPYREKMFSVEDIIRKEMDNNYNVESRVIDCADYGVPQHRNRNIIKVYKKNLTWEWPIKEKKISVREAIGNLPSIESGEKSKYFWHFGRKHSENQIICMKYTPTGKTAFDNEIFFPTKQDGSRVKGYNTTYKRIEWDQPSPTITIRNDAISSQSNVHPGRKLKDGTYSDARVLSLMEIFILNSLPPDFNPPKETSEILIRQVMGECIPPLLLKNIFNTIT